MYMAPECMHIRQAKVELLCTIVYVWSQFNKQPSEIWSLSTSTVKKDVLVYLG